MVRPSLTHKTKEGMIMIPTNNDSFGASYCRSEHKIENGQGKLPDYVRVSVVRGYVYTTVGCDLLKESFNVLGEQVQNGLRSGYEAGRDVTGALSYGSRRLAENAVINLAKAGEGAPRAFKNVGDGVEEAACNVWRSLNMCCDKSRTDRKPTGGGVAGRGTTDRKSTDRKSTGREKTDSSKHSGASTVQQVRPSEEALIGLDAISKSAQDYYCQGKPIDAGIETEKTLGYIITLLSTIHEGEKDISNLQKLFNRWSNRNSTEDKGVLWKCLKNKVRKYGVTIEGNKQFFQTKSTQYKIRFGESLSMKYRELSIQYSR